MPSKHDHHKKQTHQVPASQANLQQVQELLARYQFIAAALQTNTEAAQDEETLAPITSLDENTQLALVKELGKELTTAAADVLQAIYTYAPAKEVSKEARRSLIRLEASDLYPEWEPPTASLLDSLSQVLLHTSDSDDEDEGADAKGLLSELEAQLASLMPVSPAELTVSSYLQAWTEGAYGDVYDHLTTDSPLRESLERDAWIERRRQWQQAAQPTAMRVLFVRSVEDDPHYPEVVDAGWSLVFTDTELDTPLPELPIATITYPETGRHWFWTRYRVVENQYIQEMTDEGASALTLPEEELAERIEEFTRIANERLEELQEEDEDFDLDEEEEDLATEDEDFDLDEEEEDEDFDEDFEEDDEDFDEEDEDLDIKEMMDRVQEAFGITSIALSYTDALIARSTELDPVLYQTPYNLAIAMMDHERAAVYMSLMAARVPDKRGEALTELASSLSLIANQYDEEGDTERTGHFLHLAETNLREALMLTSEPRSKVLLAQVLLAQGEQPGEAETLLHEAKAVEMEPRLETLADVSLARIAQERGENKQALNYYMEAAAIHPDFPNLWLYIGHLQAELGQIDEAEQSLLRNIEQEPETADAYLELASLYDIHKHNLEKAEFIIGQGLEAIPDSADLLVAQAIILINKGDFVQAEQSLDEAEEIDPEVELLQEARTLLLMERQKSQTRRAKPKYHKRKK
jgi:tetratricopeptide (TPR) repeat protein